MRYELELESAGFSAISAVLAFLWCADGHFVEDSEMDISRNLGALVQARMYLRLTSKQYVHRILHAAGYKSMTELSICISKLARLNLEKQS